MARNLALRSALSIAVTCLVLGACTTTDPGNATSDGGTTTAVPDTSEQPTATTKSAGGSGKLANFDPCAEMNAVAGKLALGRIEEDGKKECKAKWGDTTTSVRVKAFPELGMAEVAAGPDAQSSDIEVGSHKAKLIKAPLTDTDCAVVIEITAKSRVDFVGSSTTSADEACDAAKELAEAVEPKLPK